MSEGPGHMKNNPELPTPPPTQTWYTRGAQTSHVSQKAKRNPNLTVGPPEHAPPKTPPPKPAWSLEETHPPMVLSGDDANGEEKEEQKLHAAVVTADGEETRHPMANQLHGRAYLAPKLDI